MYRYILVITILINSILADEIKILSAANLKFFFSDIVKDYNKKYPNDIINVEFDSSGSLSKSIQSGTSYDIFLAANMRYPQTIYELGYSVIPAKLYTTGSLILLVAKYKELSSKKLLILEDPRIKEITIANKQTAPYGMAAIQALKQEKVYNKIK